MPRLVQNLDLVDSSKIAVNRRQQETYIASFQAFQLNSCAYFQKIGYQGVRQVR